jgi:hypothetical protein
VTSAALAKGECEYCHTALPKAAPAPPPVVHVTKVEIKAPDVEVGQAASWVGMRIAGCFSGCLSAGVSLAITGMILLFVAWQLWVSSPAFHPPSPSPSPSHRRH